MRRGGPWRQKLLLILFFLKASIPVSHNQSARSVITSLTIKDIMLLLLFAAGAMAWSLGSFLGRHDSLTPRGNLELPITLMCKFWSVGGKSLEKNLRNIQFKRHFSADAYHSNNNNNYNN